MTRHVDYCQRIREHLSSSCLLTEERIESVLPRLCSSLHALMHNLEDLVDCETGEAIRRASHTLKGALLNLGLHELAEKAVIIERSSLEHGATADYARLVDELKEEIEKLP